MPEKKSPPARRRLVAFLAAAAALVVAAAVLTVFARRAPQAAEEPQPLTDREVAEVKAAVEKQTGIPIRYVSGIRRGTVDAFPDGIPGRPAYRVEKTNQGWKVVGTFYAFFEPAGVTRSPTPQEAEGVTAAVRERTGDSIRSIRVCDDGSALAFVTDGRGRQEYRVRQVEGRWRVVGGKEFYRS